MSFTQVMSLQNGKCIPSMEVAEMVEKSHNDLMKDIRRYVSQLGEGKISQSDFFTESTYTNERGKEYPCYDVTRKGCEFIANKMTGTKGAIFTAKFINRFHDMELMIATNQFYQSRIKVFNDIIPKPNTWLSSVDEKLEKIQKSKNITRSKLYYEMMLSVGCKHDINYAREVYKRDFGRYPDANIDLLECFPQLQEDAEKYIEKNMPYVPKPYVYDDSDNPFA